MVTRAAARTEDYTFDLSGGRLCLDFANTVGRSGRRPAERSPGLVRRFHRLGGTGRGDDGPRGARPAARRRGRSRRRAREVLADAIRLREALYRVFAAVASGRTPRAADLAIVNAAVPAAFERSRLVPSDGGFTLTADVEDGDLAAPLTPVVRSAVDLLVSPDVDRVRTCAATACAWLFLDTTKNRARRWCDMKTCGNREKVRRFRDSLS